MGNTKSQARGLTSARGGAPVEDDPFAELADMFEAELQHDTHREETGRGRRAGDEPGFDHMEREFEAAFENDLAAARGTRQPAFQTPSYETRTNGRATARIAAPRKAAETRPTHPTDDEIDSELESVLRNLSAPAKPRSRIVVETQSFAPERAAEERLPPAPQAEVDEFEELIRSELAVIRPAMMNGAGRQARYAEPVSYQDFEPEQAGAEYRNAPHAGRPVWKRRLMAGGSLAVFLLVAGAGFGMWQNGASGVAGSGDEPFLIKADAEPYKIVPKDPGGRAYPNQNKAVYDRVAPSGGNVDTPMQQALLKNVEEPMDIPAEEEGRSYAENLPGVELGEVDGEGAKDQTRVTAETETGEEAVLQPRKVRTTAVGPDGKLTAAAEMPAPAAQKPGPAVDGAAAPSLDINQVADLQVNEAQPTPVATPRHNASKPASAPDPVQTATVTMTEPAPQIASVEPAAPSAPMPDTGFFVQVSSQPSEAAAQQSLRTFGNRYGSVVGGRPVGIKSAEVAGKGTYWRVRVAANSKEEASSLCSKLKSAGASCLVTR